jgi:predicted outer membrane lipoprotein
VAIALPEPIDQFAWVLAGPLAAAYALQGLAVLHALSRGLPLRPLLIAALYFCCGVRATWTMPLIALVGLIDSAVNLRARAAAARGSKI